MRRTIEPAEVWTDESGAPERLVWRARRYRVDDRPTPLVGPADWWMPFDGNDEARPSSARHHRMALPSEHRRR